MLLLAKVGMTVRTGLITARPWCGGGVRVESMEQKGEQLDNWHCIFINNYNWLLIALNKNVQFTTSWSLRILSITDIRVFMDATKYCKVFNFHSNKCIKSLSCHPRCQEGVACPPPSLNSIQLHSKSVVGEHLTLPCSQKDYL